MSAVNYEDELAPITQKFGAKLNIDSSGCDKMEDQSPPSDEEFSFSSARFELVSADDVFYNGQIRPVFPFFNQTLVSGYSSSLEDDKSLRSPVRKVLVESSAGAYRELDRKPNGTSPEKCEKSNSTGFSKVWRLREMEQRSNSDGRDAFVFLKKENERQERAPAKGSKGNNRKGKGKTGLSPSAHEMHYVENKERREKGRMRSYLPYRTGLFGFFTSASGGLSKNVHPY